MPSSTGSPASSTTRRDSGCAMRASTPSRCSLSWVSRPGSGWATATSASTPCVRPRVAPETGELSFQEWFVGKRCEPPVRGLRFDGLEAAVPAPAAVRAVSEADLVVIGPSNPLLSVAPMTALIGPHLERERVIAISPVIGGRALKGPTVALMEQLGEEP